MTSMREMRDKYSFMPTITKPVHGVRLIYTYDVDRTYM